MPKPPPTRANPSEHPSTAPPIGSGTDRTVITVRPVPYSRGGSPSLRTRLLERWCTGLCGSKNGGLTFIMHAGPPRYRRCRAVVRGAPASRSFAHNKRQAPVFTGGERCRCRKLYTMPTRAALTMYHSNGTRRATHSRGTAPTGALRLLLPEFSFVFQVVLGSFAITARHTRKEYLACSEKQFFLSISILGEL